MENISILLLLFAIVLVFATILAVAIGYFWATSTTKSTLLRQLKDQSDATFKNAQEQLQNWKEQELTSVRQQIYDAAKGQAIQEMQEQVRKWQQNELQQIRLQMLDGARGEAIRDAQNQLIKWRNEDLENAKSQIW